jgi:hypothetical protein
MAEKKIRIEHVEAENISFGDYSIINRNSSEECLRRARSEIAKLIEVLPQYRADIEYENAMESAQRANSELGKRQYDGKRVRRCLEALQAAVGNVATLASAVTAVQAAVRHL